MMSIMNEAQLRRLAQHKYSAQSTEILDPIFQVYWRWLVQQVPLWLAPNTITFLGLFINAATSLILFVYCPQAKGSAPGWAFILCGVGLFVYQSLDAIDGKQARRTNSNSPLGELVDHGCDAVSMVLVTLAFSVAIELGNEPIWMFFVCFSASVLFYCSHWQAYVSGTIKFGWIDVTELQLFAMAAFIATGIFGTEMWMMKVPFFNITFKQGTMIIAVLGTLYTLCSIFSQIYQGGMGKNGSTIAGTSVVSPLFPITIVLYMAYTTAKTSRSSLFLRYPCLFVMAYGLMCAKVTIKLVVACMSKSPLEVKDATMLGGVIMLLNTHYGSHIDEYLMLCLLLLYVVFDLCRYCVILCNQICDFLNIRVFSIKPVERAEGKSQ
ncbi:cholinephosphotransferase 1-like [Nematostella vectensis]|uniref:cholinephosphotransferase 1-like n=1 Tax=Nematostella vectensis TaxID=45351 RepID=UPI0020774A52|nr:cholinephosphotransferase 1-like [Nematostella vectensis]XP_048584731.1 cholinephosphotransferase 1-like [Nematostella vectensis]XP_048584732.1 cholinephosphotransferase 1-like [Nematostella vectensis]